MSVRFTDGDRAGWRAWLGVIVFAIAYGLIVLWVLGMVRP